MAEKERFPYISIEVDAFTSDELVEAMTTEEVGAYFLLMCKAWKSDPPCTIPTDDATLARWARLTDKRWKACKTRVLAAWRPCEDGRLYQKRLLASRVYAAEAIEKKRLAGSKGGRTKAAKQQQRQPVNPSTAIASLEQCSSTGGSTDPSKPLAESSKIQSQLQLNVSSIEETKPPTPLTTGSAEFRFIDIDGESVLFDGNHESWVAEFIRRWNLLAGVRPHEKQVLTHINLMALRDRLSEPDWDWPSAFKKFPLYLPSGVWPIPLGTFLEASTVSKILDGKYERRTGASAGRSPQEIGHGQRFDAEGARSRGVNDL